MPAHSLPPHPGAILASPFCVVGQYELKTIGLPGSTAAPVRHVGLVSPGDRLDPGAGTVSISTSVPIPVDHLKALPSCQVARDDSIPVHVIGAIGPYGANLTSEQAKDLEIEAAKLDGEHLVYFAHPPIERVKDPTTGRVSTRISCVGFVLSCYRNIGVELLAPLDAPAYPTFSLTDLLRFWPELAPLATRPPRLARIGLNLQTEPWPVVMPGYLFHALASGVRFFQPTSPTQADFWNP